MSKDNESATGTYLCTITAVRLGIKESATAEGTSLGKVEAWGYRSSQSRAALGGDTSTVTTTIAVG